MRDVVRAARLLRPLAQLTAGVLLAGASACAKDADETRRSSRPPAKAANPVAIFRSQLGRTWSLARLGEQSIPVQPRSGGSAQSGTPGQGSRPTIRFTDQAPGALSSEPGALSAGGRSFCNGYGTAYFLGPGDQLRFKGFQSTLVGCDGPDSLETRFFRALGTTQRFALDSGASPPTLELIAADGSRLTFVAATDSGGR